VPEKKSHDFRPILPQAIFNLPHLSRFPDFPTMRQPWKHLNHKGTAARDYYNRKTLCTNFTDMNNLTHELQRQYDARTTRGLKYHATANQSHSVYNT